MAIESRRLRGLVARAGVPTTEPNPRTIINVVIPERTVPVFKGAPGTYRELVGTAELTLTDEGVVAEMELPPYLAAELLRDGGLNAHIEGEGGFGETRYNPETGGRDVVLDGLRVRTLYCSGDAPAWNDLWMEER